MMKCYWNSAHITKCDLLILISYTNGSTKKHSGTTEELNLLEILLDYIINKHELHASPNNCLILIIGNSDLPYVTTFQIVPEVKINSFNVLNLPILFFERQI